MNLILSIPFIAFLISRVSPFTLEENKLISCLLLYYSKWDSIKNDINLLSNDTVKASKIKCKAKGMLLERCNLYMTNSMVEKVNE